MLPQGTHKTEKGERGLGEGLKREKTRRKSIAGGDKSARKSRKMMNEEDDEIVETLLGELSNNQFESGKKKLA